MVQRDAIRKLIAQRNRELTLQAAVEFVLGVIFSIIVFGAVFWIAYLAGFFCINIWKPLPFALAVTGVFALVSVVSAWRQVEPFAGMSPLSEGQEFRADLAQALGYAAGVPVFTRRSIAGIGSVLIGGPANLFEAISTLRHRLPSGRALTASAAEVLDQARTGVNLDDIADPRAALLLHRLTLVKVEPVSDDAARLVLTQKGFDALAGGGS